MEKWAGYNLMLDGKTKDVYGFISALKREKQKDGTLIWIGNGAYVEVVLTDRVGTADEEPINVVIPGCVKWGVHKSFFEEAKYLQRWKNGGKGAYRSPELDPVDKVFDLFQAAKHFNVNMEVFATAPGDCLAEHARYMDGEELYEKKPLDENGNGYEECYTI